MLFDHLWFITSYHEFWWKSCQFDLVCVDFFFFFCYIPWCPLMCGRSHVSWHNFLCFVRVASFPWRRLTEPVVVGFRISSSVFLGVCNHFLLVWSSFFKFFLKNFDAHAAFLWTRILNSWLLVCCCRFCFCYLVPRKRSNTRRCWKWSWHQCKEKWLTPRLKPGKLSR